MTTNERFGRQSRAGGGNFLTGRTAVDGTPSAHERGRIENRGGRGGRIVGRGVPVDRPYGTRIYGVFFGGGGYPRSRCLALDIRAGGGRHSPSGRPNCPRSSRAGGLAFPRKCFRTGGIRSRPGCRSCGRRDSLRSNSGNLARGGSLSGNFPKIPIGNSFESRHSWLPVAGCPEWTTLWVLPAVSPTGDRREQLG